MFARGVSIACGFAALSLGCACAGPKAATPAAETKAIAGHQTLAPTPAPPQVSTRGPRARLLVLPLRSTLPHSPALGAAETTLVARLAASGRYEVVSLKELGSLLQQQRLQDLAGCDDVSCAGDLAGALDAPFVLMVSIEPLGNRWLVSGSIVDARSATVSARAVVSLPSGEGSLGRGMEATASRLLGEPDDPALFAAIEGRSGVTVLLDRAVCKEPLGQGAFADALASGLGNAFPFVAIADDLSRSLSDRQRAARDQGAAYAIAGEACCNDTGKIMGTQMHSLRANASVRLIRLETMQIVATATHSGAAGHIDAATGCVQALTRLAEKTAQQLLKEAP